MSKKKTVSGYKIAFLITQSMAVIFWVIIILVMIPIKSTFKNNKTFLPATATYTGSEDYTKLDDNGNTITRYINYYTYEIDNEVYEGYQNNCVNPANEGGLFTIYYDPSNPNTTSFYPSYKEASKHTIPTKILACILQIVAIITFVIDHKQKKEERIRAQSYREAVLHEAKRDFERVDCGINEAAVYELLEPQRLSIYALQKKYDKPNAAIALPGPLVIITFIMVAIQDSKKARIKDKLDEAKNSFFIDYKRRIAEPLLSGFFPTYRYLPSQGIGKEELVGLNVFQKHLFNNFETEDYVEGTYKNIFYHQSDLILKHASGKSTTTVFNGRIGIYDYKKSGFDGELIISSKTYAANTNIGQLEKVELENVKFNMSFDVYADSSHSAFYILTPHFMEHIMNLNVYGDLYMRFTNDKICILRNNISGMFEPDFEKPLDIQFEIGRSYHELKEIQDFIDALNLER